MEQESQIETQLITDEDLETQLIKSENLNAGEYLRCYLYKEYHYNIHIICSRYPAEMLQEKWKIINDEVAFKLQAKIKDLVERYNIYIIFFAPGISQDLRMEIEFDRYCSRKIVLTEKMPEDKQRLFEIIKQKLFHLDAEPGLQQELPQTFNMIKDKMKEIEPSGKLMKKIENLSPKLTDFEMEEVIEILSNVKGALV